MLLGELDRDSESLSIALSVQQCIHTMYIVYDVQLLRCTMPVYIQCVLYTMYNYYDVQCTLLTIYTT